MTDEYWIPYGYSLRRQAFRSYEQDRHMMTFGPTRSGKGATIIVPALLTVEHSVICIDPKGQNAAIAARRRRDLGQRVYMINPFDELGLGSSRFNPLAHLSIDDPNIVADIASLAEALIVDESSSPHWSDSARALVRAILLHLIATKGSGASLGDLRRLLTLPLDGPPGTETFPSLIVEMVTSEHSFVRQPAGRFTDVGSREIASIVSTAITQTDFLDDPRVAATLSGSDFTIVELKTQPTTVFLILPARYFDAYAKLFRIFVTSAIDQLTAAPGERPVLFILDEFASLRNLPAVLRAFAFAAGYRIQIWPFLQDLPQLKALYPHAWESFLANSGFVQFLTPNDMTTTEYIRRRAGRRKIMTESYSRREISVEESRKGFEGLTSSYSEQEEDVVDDRTIMSWRDDSQMIFFAGQHGLAIESRFPYFKNSRLAGHFDPDPFHPKPYKGWMTADFLTPAPEPTAKTDGGPGWPYRLGRGLRRLIPMFKGG